MTTNSKTPPRLGWGEGGVEAFFPGKELPKLPEIVPGKLYTSLGIQNLAILQMNSPTTWDSRIRRIYSPDWYFSSIPFMALGKLLVLEKFGSDSFALTEDELPVEGKAYALVFRALLCEKEEWLVVDEHTGVAGKNRYYRTCLRNSILPWQPEHEESQV